MSERGRESLEDITHKYSSRLCTPQPVRRSGEAIGQGQAQLQCGKMECVRSFIAFSSPTNIVLHVHAQCPDGSSWVCPVTGFS